MRWLVYAVALLAFAPRAFADDLDVLRGSQPVGPALFARWSGFYFGGQVGYGQMSGDFSNSTNNPIAYNLRNSTLQAASAPSQMQVLGIANQNAASYGAFAGFNTQWQDLILGIEANYTHSAASLNAPNSPIARSGISDGDGHYYTVGISGSGTLTDLNYGSLRARAGLALGNFMPYGFAGFALGVANINVVSSVALLQEVTPAVAPIYFGSTTGGDNAVLYGFTVGGGLDVALSPNFFLRGEFEYVRFAPYANILVSIASARVGAGVKF